MPDIIKFKKNGKEEEIVDARYMKVPLSSVKSVVLDCLEICKLLKIPEHLAISESVKKVKELTGHDLSDMLALSTTQDKIDKEDKMLDPAELGKLFGVSTNEVNKILEAGGYQSKINGEWVPTEDGKKYSSRYYHECKG